jgi:transcriptional regulator with XRE-family HTH domain
MKTDSTKFDPAVIEAEENLLLDYQFLVQELMVKKNISRADLSAATGLSQARLSQLLGSEANPTLKTMARIIHALGERPYVSTKGPENVEKKPRSAQSPRPVQFGWGDLASNDNLIRLDGAAIEKIAA